MQDNSLAQISEVSKILPVIVLYNTNLFECETYKTLVTSLVGVDEVIELFVYDNSGTAAILPCSKDNFNIHYIYDVSNSGISKAYNQAAVLARELNKDWLLFLDHDTNVAVNFFGSFLKYKMQYEREVLFCPILRNEHHILSPSLFYLHKGFPAKKALPGLVLSAYRIPLNSGLIVKLDFFNEVGGYNTDLPLDFSDFDFVKRCADKHKGFVVFDAICFHSLSSYDQVTVEQSLRRFKIYTRSARVYSKVHKAKIPLLVSVGLRAGRLSLRYKTFEFFTMFFKYYLKAN